MTAIMFFPEFEYSWPISFFKNPVLQCNACSFNSGAIRKYSGVSCEISFCPWSRYIPKTTLCLNANGHGLYGTIEAIQIKTDVKVYSREMIKGNKFNIQYIFYIFPIRQRLDTKLYVWNDICAPGFFNTFSCSFRNRINFPSLSFNKNI